MSRLGLCLAIQLYQTKKLNLCVYASSQAPADSTAVVVLYAEIEVDSTVPVVAFHRGKEIRSINDEMVSLRPGR